MGGRQGPPHSRRQKRQIGSDPGEDAARRLARAAGRRTGEVLAGVANAEVRPAVRKLLADPDLAVRLRVAVALACAADRQAVPVLIDLLADLPGEHRWQA